MIELLPENFMETKSGYSSKLAYIEGWGSIVLNIFLFAFKFWAGTVTGSIAVLADAWHTLSDSFTSVVVLVSARASSIPPDRKHPFGHGRAELLGSIVIGLLLAVVAFNFILDSVQRLKGGESVVFGVIAIAATSVSIVAKEGMAQFAFWASKKTGSVTLKADGWHHRSDAISSLVLLGGIFMGKYFWWVDGVMGIILAILIMYAAYEILKDSMDSFIGEAPDTVFRDKVVKIAGNTSGKELDIHHMHIHRYGDHTELTFHIRLERSLSLEEAHIVASSIESAIRLEMKVESTIHMEPKPDDNK
jgi:cation diffusion facilitator family transporter